MFWRTPPEAALYNQKIGITPWYNIFHGIAYNSPVYWLGFENNSEEVLLMEPTFTSVLGKYFFSSTMFYFLGLSKSYLKVTA